MKMDLGVWETDAVGINHALFQWLGRKKSQWANGPMLPQINGPFQISMGHGIKCMGHQWVSISKPV